MAIHGYLHNVGPRYIRPLTSAPPSSTSVPVCRRCRHPLPPPTLLSSLSPLPATALAALNPPPPLKNPLDEVLQAIFHARAARTRSLHLRSQPPNAAMFYCRAPGADTLSLSPFLPGDPYYFYAVIIIRCNDTCKDIYTASTRQMEEDETAPREDSNFLSLSLSLCLYRRLLGRAR